MSEKVVSSALEEIMEDKWIHSYFTKELGLRSSTSSCQKGSKEAAAKKRHHKEDRHYKEDTASKRLKVGSGKSRLNVDVKKRGTHGSRPLKDASSEPLRRSFWQLDRAQDEGGSGYRHRRTTRLSEKNPPKRRIRRPKWLLEDSGTLEENNAPLKIKRHGLRHQKHDHQTPGVKRPETGQIKNSAKLKPSVNSDLKSKENNNKQQRDLSVDCLKQAAPPQVILELSLPDNELMGTFTEDSCNRQRGLPQVLLYKPTVKLPVSPQPAKTVHGKEVILRARDVTMFVQQLHCYARRQKGKGNGSNVHSSVSTITRSSVQGSPPKDPPREPETKGRVVSEATAAGEAAASAVSQKDPQAHAAKAVSRKTSAAPVKTSAEMKVPVAPQTPAAAKLTKPPGLDKVSEAPSKPGALHPVSPARKSAAETKATAVLQTSVTEASRLDKTPQAPTVASPRKLCEETAVEMKVTIASQSPAAAKVTQCDTRLEKSSKAELSQASTEDGNLKTVSGGNPPDNIAAADPTPTQSQELRSLSSQAETAAQEQADTPDVLTTAQADVTEDSPKASRGHAPCGRDASPRGNVVTLSKVSENQVSYSPTHQDSINDISALTLVTEMVTELTPEALARDCEGDRRRAPENSASKESTAGSKPKVPHKIRTTSSCSAPDWEASAAAADTQLQKGKGGNQDIAAETSENSEAVDTEPETEESKLEYCCTFCNKVFKGSRVVAHAMFHYRKDECMFCGTMFKDDLLAMMHLSDHIEKLKRIKESADNKVQNSRVSENKDASRPKAKGRRSGRLKKSALRPNSEISQDSSPSESRRLRSNDKSGKAQLLPEKKHINASKHHHRETSVHKVNGHIGKKKEADRVKNNSEAKKTRQQQDVSQERTNKGSEEASVQADGEFACSSEHKMKETATKQNGKDAEERNVESQEKLCCPVDGCAWFTDLAKNRVALLYHALDDHSGERKPLELAFRVGNSKCSICMRVLWSFEHFQHHVERHRISPRHPCLHQGCTARFKTGMEMRRHARKHSPLQAVCCLPGCSHLFICLWALNLHEKEHYTSKSTKSDKITKEQTGNKHSDKEIGHKHQDHKPKDATAVNKAARKLRGRAAQNLSSRKHIKPFRACVLKQELKERNEDLGKNTNVLKNLSNKDTSAQPAAPNLRVRQTLAAHKTHRVISLALLKHKSKVRQKLKRKNANIPRRRGRPPKPKKSPSDENTGQSDEAGTDVKSPAPEAAETSDGSNRSTEKEKSEQEQDEVKTAQTSADESKLRKSANKKSHAQQKQTSHNSSTHDSNTAGKTHKPTTDKMNKVKKRSSQTDSDVGESKKDKITNSKVNTKTVKKKIPHTEEPETTERAKPVVPQAAAAAAATVVVERSADEDGNAKAENMESTQNSNGNTVPAVTANSLDEASAPLTTTGEKPQEVKTEEKKSDMMKKERPHEKSRASVNSGKASKKHKGTDTNGDKQTVKKKRPSSDPGKTAALKKTASSKSIVQQEDGSRTAAALTESTPDEEEKVKQEATDSSGANSIKSSPATATDENTQKVSTKSKKHNDVKALDPNKANKKRKNIHKEGETTTGKRKRKDQDDPSASKKQGKSKAEAKSSTEAKAKEAEGKTLKETPQSAVSSSAQVNGQVSREDPKSTVSIEALAKYGKSPYVRLPPTAYLDEKYITMPKRRKEMSAFQSYQRSPPTREAPAAAALQRQRCANCFATFNSAEDLQDHQQLQKCSNLFGFDSDDEGESTAFVTESTDSRQIKSEAH